MTADHRSQAARTATLPCNSAMGASYKCDFKMKSNSNRLLQELGYRIQIARHLRIPYIEGM